MSADRPDLLSTPYSYGRPFRRWRAAFRSRPLRSGGFFGTIIFFSLIFYSTFLLPQGSLWNRPQDWYGLLQNKSLLLDLENTLPSTTLPTPTTLETSSPSPSPSPTSDVLTVEQIRDLVAPTRGFFARDYNLGLGWNNVSICGIQLDPNLTLTDRCGISSMLRSSKRTCSIAHW